MRAVRPLLYAAWFQGNSDQYARLAAVLELTARRHCPDWEVVVESISEPVLRGPRSSESEAANHRKLGRWAEVVAEQPDGRPVLLVDADTFVLGALDSLWGIPFDVAITEREPGCRYPLNAGVVACRVSSGVRMFFDRWLVRDREFLLDAEARQPWRQQFGGQNQASLGALLTSATPAVLGVRVETLPCRVWNCEDSAWALAGPETRIVHAKSALRMACFRQLAPAKAWRGLADQWLRLDAEAREAVAA